MGLSEIVKCEYCGMEFTDKGLTRHQQIKHPFETPTNYKGMTMTVVRVPEAARQAVPNYRYRDDEGVY